MRHYHLLLTVLVFLAVDREALALQQLSCSFSLTERTQVFVQKAPLLLQSCFLIGMQTLQLLKTTLQLK